MFQKKNVTSPTNAHSHYEKLPASIRHKTEEFLNLKDEVHSKRSSSEMKKIYTTKSELMACIKQNNNILENLNKVADSIKEFPMLKSFAYKLLEGELLYQIRNNDTEQEKVNAIVGLFPEFDLFVKAHNFLNDVARGKEDKVLALLNENPDLTQTLLTTSNTFKDYSGREYHCTAYEYAYWAGDSDMCHSLEEFMSNETKLFLLEKVEAIENFGLAYQHKGKSYQNPHYGVSFSLKNFTPDEFITLQKPIQKLLDKEKIAGEIYTKITAANVDNYQKIPFETHQRLQIQDVLNRLESNRIMSILYDSPIKELCKKLQSDFYTIDDALADYGEIWKAAHPGNDVIVNYDSEIAALQPDLKKAWLLIGMAQRNFPAHCASKICNSNDSLSRGLQRRLQFLDENETKSWFPLSAPGSGLGYDYVVISPDKCRPEACYKPDSPHIVLANLHHNGIKLMDVHELNKSREFLKQALNLGPRT